MDTARVRGEMLSHPGWYRKGFLVQANFREHRSVYQKEIIDALGERNIRGIQFCTDEVMVITMTNEDVRDYVMVILNLHSAGSPPSQKYVIEPVFPIPASVELLLTGILEGLAEDLLDIMPQRLSEFFPELIDLEVNIIQWNGITTNGGDILVSGITKDLMKTLNGIGRPVQVRIESLIGSISVSSIHPIHDLKDSVGDIKTIWMKKICIRAT